MKIFITQNRHTPRLNMIDIQQRLKTLFEKERLVFWYDDNEALKSEFEEISINGVEKRTIDNNEFTIKREVLKLKPDAKFLIYSPTSAPAAEDNWLLDLNIANHMFSADKISLILQNLGLDVSYKPFMSRFEKFLNAKSRVEALAKKISPNETGRSLALKMIAVCINSEDTIDNILLKLFEDKRLFETIEKFELSQELFKAIKSKYAYDGESLDDFLYKLLQNHFYYYVDRSKCTLNSDARLFVNSWMDSSRFKESYAEHSHEVSEALNLKGLLDTCDPLKVASCDTYERCDQMTIAYVLKGIENDTMHLDSVKTIIQDRKNTFWYGNYQNIYQAILCAAHLIDFIKMHTYKIKDFEDGISKYVAIWHQADMHYRAYLFYASKAEHLELLKALSVKIEDMYLNGYLRELNDAWQPFAETYDVSNIKNHQQHFYQRSIEPFIQKNNKIFVIISDALRYECGMELTSKILSENKKKDRFSVNCRYMVSSLPSYTQLGMASLLPHNIFSYKDKNDTVFVDNKSSAGTLNRDKILKSYHEKSTAINYEEFISFEKAEGREFAKNHQVVYIYHDEIDKMGEKNEPKTFEAVNSTFETIIKIIKQISNFNGANIFVTSDHGFFYTNQPTLESEFCSVESNGSIRSNRRFIIGKDLELNHCVSKFAATNLGIDGDIEFLIPKSINKIRVQGGGNRFIHGGATLQELVIPLIEINIGKGKVNISEVNVEIIPIRNISTNIVNVSLYQSETVDDKTKPLTLKVAFESMDGKILSDEIRHTFDSNDQYDTNRENRFKLTFKQDINAYNNKTIKLVARKILENSSETPVYKELETKLALSFHNDFDDDF